MLQSYKTGMIEKYFCLDFESVKKKEPLKMILSQSLMRSVIYSCLFKILTVSSRESGKKSRWHKLEDVLLMEVRLLHNISLSIETESIFRRFMIWSVMKNVLHVVFMSYLNCLRSSNCVRLLCCIFVHQST